VFTDPHPLMEGEGKSLRVLGFNLNQRNNFMQILMRCYEFYKLIKVFDTALKLKSFCCNDKLMSPNIV
jgi:Domain of Unknown Function (DUF1086)